MRILVVTGLASWASSGCVPSLEERETEIATPTALAVYVDPQEVRPGERVRLRALVASPHDSAAPRWSLCLERRPLDQTSPVSAKCLDGGGELLSLGTATEIETTVPNEACRLFGPDRPNPRPGEPAGRPVDPDATGGYWLPFSLEVPGGTPSIARVRLACGLAGVTLEQLAEYNRQYRRNQGPRIGSLEWSLDGQGWASLPVDELMQDADSADAPAGASPLVDPTAVLDVRRSTALHLRVTTPAGERYVRWDPGSRSLVEQTESVRISYFSTAGRFELSRNGEPSGAAERAVLDNRWTAPEVDGLVRWWIVVRDDRGGTAWASGRLRVVP